MVRFLLVTVLLAAVPAQAHDFWIQPSTFRPAVGSVVKVSLRVGEHFSGDSVPRNNSRIESFEAVTSKGRQTIGGKEKSDPAGEFVVATHGSVMISYRGKPSFVELTPETIDQYLREEGLDTIREMRIRKGETAKGWKEGFSRCAKSLLRSGSGPAKGFDQPTGLRLELIPEARSDREGRVALQLPTSGNWLIKAVHLVPAPMGMKADWESLWASITFQAGKPAR